MDERYDRARQDALKTFGPEGVGTLEGIAADLMPDVRRIIAEIGIDQVRANIEKGLADFERRRLERDAQRDGVRSGG